MTLTRLDLVRRPFANGREFGTRGAYAELTGTAYFSLRPEHPANQAIVDLELAARDAHGQVTFSAGVRVLQPADPDRGNRRMILDVVNRGNPVAIRSTELGAGRVPDAESDGWLLQRGFTVVSCGWQHNVPPGTPRLGLRAPEARDGEGRPFTGQVRSVQQVTFPGDVFGVADETSGAVHVAYPVADIDDPTATLIEREFPLGERRLIPRDRWRFARRDNGRLESDRTHVWYADGFAPGKIYELIYTAEGAPVTGVGFAALRDMTSFLRFAGEDAGNPCAGALDHALAIGASQRLGRLLRHMLQAGLYVDEEGRTVLDGVLTLIGGPIRTELNWRFGQPSFVGSDSPGFGPPFVDLESPGPQPKVFHLNSSAEYANVACALIHTAVDGTSDARIPEHVRIYHMTGTQHGGGTLPLDNRLFGNVAAYYSNSVDYRPLVRAAVLNLDAWATEGREPPPSRYSRLSDGTLVSRQAVREATRHLPGPGMPRERLYPTQKLDYGPESGLGRARFPATDRGSYPDLLPAVDADGNELSGVRLPDVAVPLATYTGWNPRHPSIGGSEMNLLLNGSTIPFDRRSVDRQATGDQRPSIEERYASRQDFLDQVRRAATDLAAAGYVLEADVETMVQAAGRRYDELMALESPLPPAPPA